MTSRIVSNIENPMPERLSTEEWRALPQKSKDAIIQTVEKYGDDKWWLSNDPIEVAKHQVFEDVLMVEFGMYHEGLRKLLGRPVLTSEISLNNEGLMEEARQVIKAREKGTYVEPTDEQQNEKVARALGDFRRAFEEKGNEVIPIPQEGDPATIAKGIVNEVQVMEGAKRGRLN